METAKPQLTVVLSSGDVPIRTKTNFLELFCTLTTNFSVGAQNVIVLITPPHTLKKYYLLLQNKRNGRFGLYNAQNRATQ